MILCVNANAAIDKTVVVPGFRLGEIHRPKSALALPGGKGANVARALKRLGEPPVVTGWVGGYNGRLIDAGLRVEGIDTAFVEVDAESRTCLSILDPDSGAVTEIYEKGDPIPVEKVEELRGLFESLMPRCSAVTMSGSLPPGVPSDLYAQLIEVASAAQVPVFLDSSGEALRRGVMRAPFLVKPNAREFEDLAGRAMESLEDLGRIAAEVAERRATIVAVSLGADGMLMAGRGDLFRVRPPRLEIKSAVGSGDCLLAGVAYGVTRGWSLREAARYGVAAGTANALRVGAGTFDMADFRRVLAQTDIVD
jgi:tagatose 6-phosphate kinase